MLKSSKYFAIPKIISKERIYMQKIRPDMDIGFAIKTARRRNRMTQDQVVAKLQLMGIDTSKSNYAKIETNRMNIKVSELVALKIIFDVPFDDFFSECMREADKNR